MDTQRFYDELFRPIEERIGRLDEGGIVALMGFDGGGPVNLATVGYRRREFATYITSELALRPEQKASAFGRFELMITCDDEAWAHDILSRLGRMSLGSVLGHGHTVDIGPVVKPGDPLQGLVLERFSEIQLEGTGYGIIQVHGITRPELEFARANGADRLLSALKRLEIYPGTSVRRKDSVAVPT